MTRGGGRGSSRGRGSRELGATRGGWAPLAPPREAPASLRPRPLRARRARLRRVAAAAAAAMSPGKPGAGGAGTRRTGWRRRRRRRRLETETRAPGFGHTAGRVPGTFQGAQGMKPAARETRTPPRSPGLRWALLPLLLLLRQGQVLCAGAAPNPIFDIEAVVSPTSVLLTWKHNDSGASECRIENKMESNLTFPVKNQTSCNITGLSPGTSYTFSIISVTTNETLNKTITTEPWPVSDLHVTSVGVTQARLTWSNANGTASYRMLIEELTTHSSVNISGLKPGTNNSFAFPESNETQAD